eukprot:751972-Pyramimonas_sp.AAC.1
MQPPLQVAEVQEAKAHAFLAAVGARVLVWGIPNQPQEAREHIPGAGTNQRGIESIFLAEGRGLVGTCGTIVIRHELYLSAHNILGHRTNKRIRKRTDV